MPTKQGTLALLNDPIAQRILQRWCRRFGAKWSILVLLASILTACAPIAPVSQSVSTSVTTDKEPATTDAVAPEVDAALIRVESLLDNFHKADLFNGVALIAQDGKIIWSKGWGMADRQQDIPNTSQTIFRIYQMTEQFTAAAMLLLEQEGKLKMEDPICTYLDDCPATWQPLTIHHLLTHTSGIPDYFDIDLRATNKFTRQGATPTELVALFRDQPLVFTPGDRYEWSNSGFVLAGLIIERAAGQPYDDFVQHHLLDPLGMAHSGYGEPREEMALGYRTAYTKEPIAIHATAFYAAGGLYSTVEDLFRWNEALYNGQVLNETQLQKMLTAHITTDGGNGWGYGLATNEHYGHKWSANGGVADGYAVRNFRYLDDQITILLLCNQDVDISQLGEQVDKMFFDVK